MQYEYSLLPKIREQIQRTISEHRLKRYLFAAKGDQNLAFRLYLWNIRLCEAFYLPCHLCEVTLRNGVHEALKAKYRTEDWHLEHSVMVQLPVRLQSELNSVWYRAKADHGASATVHHVIAGLSLGFWNSFLSGAYRHILWHGGMRTAFPLVPAGETLYAVHGRVEQFRTLRNRIFHHNAIFDKGPTAEWQNIDTLIGWRCHDTQLFAREESSVSRTINARPRI
jgi:hypothetical protein